MKQKKQTPLAYNDGWCFAVVNNKLAEIFFKKKFGIHGHCYVNRSKYSKREQQMIDEDVKHCQFTYRKGYYFDKIRGIKQKVPSLTAVFPELAKYRSRRHK